MYLQHKNIRLIKDPIRGYDHEWLGLVVSRYVSPCATQSRSRIEPFISRLFREGF